MHMPQGGWLYTCRFLAVVTLILGNLFLVSLIPSVINTNGSTAPASNTRHVTTSEDPNVVAGGLGDAVYRAGQAMDTTGQAAGRLLGVIGTASASVGTGTSKIVLGGLGFVGRSFVGTLSFIAHIPGTVVGSFAKTPVVSAAIKPTSNTQIPIIDPSAANAKASAMLATAAKSEATPIATSTDNTPAWPIHGAITTLFGVPHWPYQPTHTGLDISDGKASGTTPIKPYRPGKVIDVIRSNTGLGNHVIIDHGGGITSVYGHMASLAVQPGQSADKNTVLGYEGSTGASTGTHLHFEIRVNGQPVDPRQYVNSPL